MGAIIEKIKAWWQSADKTQRMVSIFGTALLVVLIAASLYFASRPQFVAAFSGLSPADQGMVVNELNRLNIPVQVTQRGDVLVPASRLSEVNMKLAQANALPSGGPAGTKLLDGLNSMTTPAVERERIKSALEGELARTIMTMDGVASAVVHLTIGQQSRVLSNNNDSTAAVIVTPSPTAELSTESGKAIARLVQNSVPGLKEANVSVTDASGRFLYDGRDTQSGAALASRKIEAEIAESRRLEQELQRLLDVPFGVGNTVARVRAELQMDEVSERVNSVRVEDGVITEKSTEKLSGTGSTNGGPAGIQSNIAGADPTASTNGGNYEATTQVSVIPQTETLRNRVQAPGALAGMAITVLVNEDKVEDVEAVQQAVAGFAKLAYDPTNGIQNTPTIQAVVTPTAFDNSAAQAQAKVAAAAGTSAMVQQAVSLLPIVVLLIVGFLLARAIAKGGPAPTNRAALAGAGGGSLPYGPAGVAGNMGALGAGASSNPAIAAMAAQRSAGGNGNPLAILEGADDAKMTQFANLARQSGVLTEADRQALFQTLSPEQIALIEGCKTMEDVMIALGMDPNEVDVEGIKRKIDMPLEQIKKLARQRPEVVAMLLKSWVMDERK